MTCQRKRHTPASPVPVALTIAQHNQQRHFALIRLLGTTLIAAALLTGATLYAKANTKEKEEKADTAQTTPLHGYMDDRSSPQKLIESYYNAVNRKEYARAYSYYAEGQQGDDFKKYAKGYENTASVKFKLGKTHPDPGAGQIYWSLPIAIEAKDTNGKSQVFTGCYTIKMSNPAMQQEPPFRPMTIMAGTLSKSPLSLEKSVPEECGAP